MAATITRVSSGSTFETDIGYCRALRAGDWVLVAGTTGYDYDTMTLPEGVVAQTERALGTIAAALEQAGASIAEVVRVRYLLPDPDDFALCWPTLRAWFAAAPPTATMQVCRLLDPMMRIEIEATAFAPLASTRPPSTES